VKWPPTCEDVSPEAEERPLLENVKKHGSEYLDSQDCLCMTVICEV
jgi:hypothetical protein